MSKLYNQYIMLKINNPSKYFLFKSGMFYIFLDEDAKLMSKVLNLKLSALNADIVKCGFPHNSLEKYLNILNTLNYDVEIVLGNNPILNNNILNNLITDVLETDIDKLSISQAYDFLYKIQNEISKISNRRILNEKKKESL
ncbi:MAG: hypothetical protein HFJ17_04625 [Clostridia bacterium]|nr:hypothetical protein [Clostridia bacterium]